VRYCVDEHRFHGRLFGDASHDLWLVKALIRYERIGGECLFYQIGIGDRLSAADSTSAWLTEDSSRHPIPTDLFE